jgi:hypothetical protein
VYKISVPNSKKKGGMYGKTRSVILNAEKQNMAPKEFELAK